MNSINLKIQGFFMALIIGSVSGLSISDAISQEANAQVTPSCNNTTIKGSYGINFTGTFGTQPVAVVGLVNFNGEASFQGTGTLNFNGTISPNRLVSGNYSVKQDCTLQILIEDIDNTISSLNGVIVDGGKEIFLIQTNPNIVFTGTFKRVN